MRLLYLIMRLFSRLWRSINEKNFTGLFMYVVGKLYITG